MSQTKAGLNSDTHAPREDITLDGSTLVVDPHWLLRHNSIAIESTLVLARRQPEKFLMLVPALLSRARFPRQELDESSILDVSVLPYDEGAIRFLREQRSKGRRIVLAAGGYPGTAARIAQYLGVFDEVREGTGANVAPASLKAGLNPPRSRLRDWLRALRLHQWLKNLLVLVPLIASHRYIYPLALFHSLVAILCFGMMASGVYILNDLLDISDDRHHQTKRKRPFAAGTISIGSGLAAVPVLTAGSLLLALWLLEPRFSLALLAYLGLTLAYTLTLKRRMVVDVIVLAVLYTLRIIAGGFAISVPLSFWLLAFSMFLFLSLALVKRYAELFQVQASGSTERARGRGYWPSDLNMIASLGAAAGYMAIMVLALYVNDPGTTQLYSQPKLIWFACPLLLMWVSRVWMLAHRGHMNEDPLVFAVRDRVSLILGALVLCVFWAAG